MREMRRFEECVLRFDVDVYVELDLPREVLDRDCVSREDLQPGGSIDHCLRFRDEVVQ